MEPTVTAITVRREPGPFVRSLTALILRLGLGLVLLGAGLQKFDDLRHGGDDPSKYPANIRGMFKDTFLTKQMPGSVDLFTRVLPYAEVGLGAALVAGLLTSLTAFLAGVLLLHLLFGQIVLHNTQMFPTMLIYLLVAAGILWLSPVTSNYLSLDGLFAGWFWRPKAEGPYVAEAPPPERRRL